ncbi:MAG: hemolysin III family protein [Chitinophagaceae bacterium]|nr:hemolysin III family protein [Oligoflexus sp.]
MESPSVEKLAKPLLRGRFHEAAAFISLGACLMLLDLCRSSGEFTTVTIYSLSLVGLFTSSAIYHRVHWGEKARSIMRRIDHAAIFALIAGTTTPVFYLTLPDPDNHKAIALIWTVAAVGIIQSIFWINAPKWLAAILYVAAGWLGFPFISAMSHVLGTSGITLMLSGGIIYTVGALIYGLKKPNPWPQIFGYHEIFHILVGVAAICHFILIKHLLQTS